MMRDRDLYNWFFTALLSEWRICRFNTDVYIFTDEFSCVVLYQGRARDLTQQEFGIRCKFQEPSHRSQQKGSRNS